MSELERLDDMMNGLISQMVSDIYALRDPDGHRIEIPTKDGQNVYRYFIAKKSGVMFCWTVHPDTNGNYWTFEYRPVGKGSGSGKAVRYRAVNLTRARRRKLAKARAIDRYRKENP